MREHLGKHAQDGPSTAAHIENVLVAPQWKAAQQLGPDRELSPASRVQIARDRLKEN
jgi:hypothetical protein